MTFYLIILTFIMSNLQNNYASPEEETFFNGLSEALRSLVNSSAQEKAAENLIHRILPSQLAELFEIQILLPRNEHFGNIHVNEKGLWHITATSGIGYHAV